jgi:hypothetical protein
VHVHGSSCMSCHKHALAFGLQRHDNRLRAVISRCDSCWGLSDHLIATRLGISLDISCSCDLVQLGVAEPFTTASAWC